MIFSAAPVQLSGLRRRLREWLGPLGLEGADKDDVILAVNEAASNCVDHAYLAGSPGSMTMTCWTEPGLLFVEVADDGVWRIPIGPANGRGHGVHLMRSLVDEVQIRHNRHGTRVLLRCRTTTATPQHSHRGTPADPELAGHRRNRRPSTTRRRWTADMDKHAGAGELGSGLRVACRYLRPDRLVVEVRGELDAFTVPDLQAYLVEQTAAVWVPETGRTSCNLPILVK